MNEKNSVLPELNKSYLDSLMLNQHEITVLSILTRGDTRTHQIVRMTQKSSSRNETYTVLLQLERLGLVVSRPDPLGFGKPDGKQGYIWKMRPEANRLTKNTARYL